MQPTYDISKMVESALQLQLTGRAGEAADLFGKVHALNRDPTSAILHASVLPPICGSIQERTDWRTRLTQRLQGLVDQGVKLDITDQLAIPGFLEHYHGVNDRELQELRAKLYRPPPDPPRRARRSTGGGKIRLGMISKYFRDHTIGKLNLGLVAALNRDEFHLTVLHAQPGGDRVTESFKQHADQYVPLPPSLPQMRQTIAEQDLDVLYYTDVGMEPVTYTLAHSRLAPIQCVTWGHPVTTGLSTIDYFVSSEAADTPEASSHYSERLIRLSNLAVYYYRPKLPSPGPGPEYFGLPSDAHFYGCLQSLQKFQPDFDSILAEILRRDPRGIVLLLEGEPREWGQLLKQRFERTMPDVIDRVRWMPRQNREGFLHLNALCTVMLDPIHFGGGNTTYEALGLGVPVVTWPSQLLRGRLTYALYHAMNLFDCVANSHEDYVEIALRLGTDAGYRNTISQRIASTSDVLFENPSGIRELEAFFKKSMRS